MKLCNDAIETHKYLDDPMSQKIVLNAQNILCSYLVKLDALCSYVKPNDITIDEQI